MNVAGHNKLRMAAWRSSLAELGLEAVQTYLQSGNAVFGAPEPLAEPAALGAAIERDLSERHGLAVRCLLRTRAELHQVTAANPVPNESDGARLYVFFVDGPIPVAEVLALAPDRVTVAAGSGHGVVYQHAPEGFQLAPDVGRLLARNATVTARNWNTVRRLHELLTDLP